TTERAVFGTVSNFAILFQSLFYGVGQAVQPIASVNFGAGNYDRVAQLRRMAMATAVAMGVGFCLLSELIPETLLQIYMRVTDEVMAVGPVALRRYAISFVFMGVNVVSAYYLQSLLLSWQSAVISIARGFVLCAVFVLLLPAVFGIGAIWWTMPIAEALTMAFAVVCLYRADRKLRKLRTGSTKSIENPKKS
ncbi:MAG: MATE family efflux transporter, partial [Oscillospiraceae bacterium]|nr:MATE family efflux transporter [Oscillospiraceae bacterium]